MIVLSLIGLHLLVAISQGLSPTTRSVPLVKTVTIDQGSRQDSTSVDPAFAWVNEKWTGDDKPYAAARSFIDHEFETTSDFGGLVANYQKVSQAKPRDPLAQFMWAYSGFKLAEMPHGEPDNDVLFAKLYASLLNADRPHTYNYARIMLLVNDNFHMEIPLALRLLSRDPGDVYVETSYSGLLIYTVPRDNATILKGVEIEERVAATGLDMPRAYCLLGQVYSTYGFVASSPDYYRKAISADNTFLSLVPSYDWRCKPVRHTTMVVEKRLKESKD